MTPVSAFRREFLVADLPARRSARGQHQGGCRRKRASGRTTARTVSVEAAGQDRGGCRHPDGCAPTRKPTGESSPNSSKRTIAADARWLDYEVDIAKLLDFPVDDRYARSADHRIPQGEAARGPAAAGTARRSSTALTGDRTAQPEYRNAVHEYVSAFEIAEAEAIRRRRSDFSVRRTAAAGARPEPAAPGARRCGHA